MNAPEQDTLDQTGLRLSPSDRALTILTGIVLPAVCFSLYLLARFGQLAREELLCACLAGFSAVCAGLLVYDTPLFAKHLAIRLGIYSGIPVSLVYVLANGTVLCREMSWLGPLVAAGGIVIPWGGHRLIQRKWHSKTLIGGMAYWVLVWLLICLITMLVFVVAAVLKHGANGMDSVPVAMLILFWVVVMFSLAFAPFWTLLIYTRLSVRVWNTPGYTVGNMWGWAAGISAWATAYAASCRSGIIQATEIQRALNPSCFIATAAARGHWWCVGSWPTAWRNEPAARANRQLVTFKCFELAMLTLSPSLHRSFRRLYDTGGYPVSRFIVHPILSDIVYILLKPAEWSVRLALRLLLPDFDSITRRMYPTTLPRTTLRKHTELP